MKNDSLFQKANALITTQQEDLALKLALTQIDSLPKDYNKRAEWLILASSIFKQKDELKKAFHLQQEAYDIDLKLNDSLALMRDHIKLGGYYQSESNIALFEYQDTIKGISFKDSALYFYKKNIKEFNSIKNGTFYQQLTHVNLSYLYSEFNQLDSADYHIKKAISIGKKTHDSTFLKKAYINQGLIYIYQKKYTEAEHLYLDFLTLKHDSTDYKELEHLETANGNLSYIYEKMGRFKKAYKYSEEYYFISELLYEKKQANAILAVEAKYNLANARKEEQLKTLKEKKAKERMYLWSGIGGVSALCIILFGGILYRNSKLKARNLSLSLVQQELNKQQELKQLQIQNQNKILNATLDGREKERKDIAQTLHDSVSALLSSVSMHIQVAKKKAPTQIEELDKSHRILGEASNKVRDLSHQLLSAILVKFGLAFAIDDMCEKYSNSELNLALKCDDIIPRFQVDLEIKLKNIIEEFINNIIKHSKASNATVSLDYREENLHIEITDNGIGFDTAIIASQASGVGLSQIKARIESIDGTIFIQSEINNGTSISITIPVKKFTRNKKSNV